MKHLFSRSISSFVQGKIVLSQGHKCLFSFTRNDAFFSAKTGIKKIWQYFFLKLLLRFQTNGAREQGWRSGERARLPPMWPGFDSRTRRHIWVVFVVGSRPCCGSFSPGTAISPPLNNPAFSIRSGMLESLTMTAPCLK